MAKTNYQQLRRRKEADRKNRRDAKLARRSQKGPGDSAVTGDASPADPPGLPTDKTLK
jgi:hypothetical protein